METIYCQNNECRFLFSNCSGVTICSIPKKFIGMDEKGTCRRLEENYPQWLEMRFYNTETNVERSIQIYAKGVNLKLFIADLKNLGESYSKSMDINFEQLTLDFRTYHDKKEG